MSSSGSCNDCRSDDACSSECMRRAARSPGRRTCPSPSVVNGNTSVVSQNAAAAAPAREHSKEISPRCSSSLEK